MSLGNGLDDHLSRSHDEDEAKKVQPRYVRNEKGQFLSNTPVAPFGVARDISDVEKSAPKGMKGFFGNPPAVHHRLTAQKQGKVIAAKLSPKKDGKISRSQYFKNNKGVSIERAQGTRQSARDDLSRLEQYKNTGRKRA
jgi:hypothetical protein